MKKSILITIIILLLGIIVILYLVIQEKSSVKLVKFEGATTYCNFTKNYISMQSGNNADGISALPVMDKDLLYIREENNKEDNECFYRYSNKDGSHIKFRFEGFRVFLNDKLIAVTIGNDSESLEWLRKADGSEINNLLSLYLTDDIPEDGLPGIQKIAESGSKIGIAVNEYIQNLENVIRILNPVWIYAPDKLLDEKTMEQIWNSKGLEMLKINAGNYDAEKILNLDKLSHLIISDLDSSNIIKTAKIPANIESLGIIESPHANLDFLKGNTDLEELNIFGCTSLNGIGVIKNLVSLKTLSLTGCESNSDIEPFLKLKSLKWFAPASNTNQKEFESLITAFTHLESLVLFDCGNINDLSVLEKMDKLAFLSINETKITTEPLVKLKNLQFLAYPFDMEKDSTRLADLQAQMPSTIVVPSAPFCLGTGWLLIFLPVLLIFSLSFFLMKRPAK